MSSVPPVRLPLPLLPHPKRLWGAEGEKARGMGREHRLLSRPPVPEQEHLKPCASPLSPQAMGVGVLALPARNTRPVKVEPQVSERRKPRRTGTQLGDAGPSCHGARATPSVAGPVLPLPSGAPLPGPHGLYPRWRPQVSSGCPRPLSTEAGSAGSRARRSQHPGSPTT